MLIHIDRRTNVLPAPGLVRILFFHVCILGTRFPTICYTIVGSKQWKLSLALVAILNNYQYVCDICILITTRCFLIIVFIVQSSGRLARELDTSAKQQTWQAIVLSAVLASLAFSPVR